MKKVLLPLLLFVLLVALCACGPEPDTTDPLSGYNVDVSLPFATNNAGPNTLATPRTSKVAGWMGDIITLTEDEYTDLALGSIGTRVKNLQKRLIELGYMNGTASGTFDQATALAVKLFEEAYGRQQTGKATEVMQYYLFSETVRKYTKTIVTAAPTAKTEQYRTLQRGDTGDDVQNLQQRLYELGYLSKVSGSYYDAATENAVKDFESAYGKSRTGIATIQLQQYVYAKNARSAWEVKTYTATPSPAPTARFSTLRSGSKGTAVTELQERLRELGYMKSKADGIYGEKTIEAVMLFERAYGKSETGIATASLQEVLFSYDARPYGYVATATPTPRATAQSYTTLSRGSSGSRVTELQNRLWELGYLEGEIDGVFGSATEKAVKLFESYHGATETGVATPVMQEFLFSSSAKQYERQELNDDTGWSWDPAESYSTLSKGDKNDDVKRLQERLIELGYLTGTADGYFGDGTAAAVKGFEKEYGHAQTGIATEELQKYLYSDSAKYNSKSEVAVSYSTLSSGATGKAVSNLQQQLFMLGYYDGEITGKYDTATTNAVKLYQEVKGLTRTGTASSALQKQIFADKTYNPKAPDDTPSYSEDETVTVNRPAYVKSSSAKVYNDYVSPTASVTLSQGTVVTVLRTRGEWAEVRSQSGSVGYCKLADLSYGTPPTGGSSDPVVTVNKQAKTTEKITVYKSASESAEKIGSLGKGTVITWLRTRGEWAEIQNSSGTVGYCKASKLTVYTAPEDDGWDGSGLTSSAYKPLKKGDTGEEVKTMQARLKELTFFYGDIGGNYLDKTVQGVKEFQKSFGLTPDGVATSGLLDILYSDYAPRPAQYKDTGTKSYKDLTYGSTGDAVKNLQKRLSELGFLSSGYTSGVYDEATAAAVLAVQQRMGLTQQDGQATRELQALLNKNIKIK